MGCKPFKRLLEPMKCPKLFACNRTVGVVSKGISASYRAAHDISLLCFHVEAAHQLSLNQAIISKGNAPKIHTTPKAMFIR